MIGTLLNPNFANSAPTLADFEGTVLVISHDRYFLDQTINRLVELKDGQLTEYLGNYADYVAHQQRVTVS